MKKIEIILVLSILLQFFLQSCRDDIYVFEQKNDGLSFAGDSITYSFQSDLSENEHAIRIPIQLMGLLSKSDRAISVKIDSTSGAIEGKDFNIIAEGSVLKADTNLGYVTIMIRKSEELAEASKSIWISLLNTDDFTINSKMYNNAFKIRFSDRLEIPDWWNYTLGEYSEIRHRFYIDVFGSNVSPEDLGLTINMVIYRLYVATVTYNSTHSVPLSDSNGPIDWRSGNEWMNW